MTSALASEDLRAATCRAHGDREDLGRDRRLETLERLLELDSVDVDVVLDRAALIVAEALDADRVDVFLYEPKTAALVAHVGGDTPMGNRQRAMGLDRLPLALGGRAVGVFRGGHCHADGHVDEDLHELVGIRVNLGVRSAVLCPLDVAGERRGVLSVVSAHPDHFAEADLPFLRGVARWLGLAMHRAELIVQLVGSPEEQGRREATMDLMERLTRRQHEVAVLIARGLTNGQIATRLVLTTGTVSNHVEHILRRLGVNSRVEVATLVVEIGLHRRPGEIRDEAEQAG